MDTRTYGPLTLTEVQQFLADAQSNGLTVNSVGPGTGTVSGYGTEVGYAYQQLDQQLTLALQKYPPFMANAVWGQVEKRLPPGVLRV